MKKKGVIGFVVFLFLAASKADAGMLAGAGALWRGAV